MHSTKKTEESNKKSRALLDRQINCAHGNHEWITVDGVKWCKFCGTLITKSFGLNVNDFLITTESIYYPKSPRYLPKEEPKDETEV